LDRAVGRFKRRCSSVGFFIVSLSEQLGQRPGPSLSPSLVPDPSPSVGSSRNIATKVQHSDKNSNEHSDGSSPSFQILRRLARFFSEGLPDVFFFEGLPDFFLVQNAKMDIKICCYISIMFL
jgi:hypothetical protein